MRPSLLAPFLLAAGALLAPLTAAAIAFGRWTLRRAADQPTGLFTLTLRKTPAGWRIIQDHTSSGS